MVSGSKRSAKNPTALGQVIPASGESKRHTSMRTRRARRPFHLQVNDQPEGLADVVPGMLRDLVDAVEEEVDDEVVAAVGLGADLALDGVPCPGVAVGDVVGGDLRGRVEGVEADLAVALPLGDVDLRRPARDGRQPQRRPGALGRGRDEVGREVVPASGRDGEVLLGVDRAGVVVDAAGLAGGVDGRLGEVAAAQGAVGLVHLGGAIVGVAPGVVVAEVLVEVGLAREAGCRQDNLRSGGKTDARQQSKRSSAGESHDEVGGLLDQGRLLMEERGGFDLSCRLERWCPKSRSILSVLLIDVAILVGYRRFRVS